jgi:hypothetical protein
MFNFIVADDRFVGLILTVGSALLTVGLLYGTIKVNFSFFQDYFMFVWYRRSVVSKIALTSINLFNVFCLLLDLYEWVACGRDSPGM